MKEIVEFIDLYIEKNKNLLLNERYNYPLSDLKKTLKIKFKNNYSFAIKCMNAKIMELLGPKTKSDRRT